MAGKTVITIGREFGAEGHEIGERLAEKTGYSLYDKDMLALAAKKSGIDINELASSDESLMSKFLMPYSVSRKMTSSTNDKLFHLQKDIIYDLAAKGSCIIIGRLADYILKDNPNCMKVFVYAPFEKRVDIIREKHNISYAAAKKLVKEMDSARRKYYAYYSNGNWDKKEGKDILLNRGTFSVEQCVDILEAMIMTKERAMQKG